MGKHTPGPWEAVKYSNGWTVKRVGSDKNEADVTDTFHDSISLMEGDAKLIAAAPDMKDDLHWALALLDDWSGHMMEAYTTSGVREFKERLKKAYENLNKAEGN